MCGVNCLAVLLWCIARNLRALQAPCSGRLSWPLSLTARVLAPRSMSTTCMITRQVSYREHVSDAVVKCTALPRQYCRAYSKMTIQSSSVSPLKLPEH